MSQGRILLGHIAGAHGIRGDVLIKTYTGTPEDIGAYGPLADQEGRRTFVVRVRRTTAAGVVASIDGIGDRTAAEGLKGTQLYVGRERLPPAADGEFYHADLIGLEAVDPDGREIGKVVAVRNYGAGDLLEIAPSGSRATEFVPFTEAFVPEIDVAAGRIVVRLPESPDQSDEGDDRGERQR